MTKLFRSEQQKLDYYASYDAAMELWPCPYEELYAETRYGRTHVITAGAPDAPPLVLFHGMGASSTMWYPNMAQLAKYFRVYAVDSLGDFGKSEPNRPMKTRTDCLEWMKELLDRLHLDRPSIAGQSMGGWLAAVFASAFPDRCKALVLLAPVATIAKVRPQFFLNMYPAIIFRTEGRIRKLLNWCHAAGNRPHPAFEQQFVRGFRDGVFMLRAMPSVLTREERARLPKTLFVVGSEEVIYSAEQAVREAAASGFATKLIPNASHCLTSEQAELVNEAMIRFLTEEVEDHDQSVRHSRSADESQLIGL